MLVGTMGVQRGKGEKMNMEDMQDAPGLSIMAPWAWMITSGLKDIENRYYPPTYKGQDYRGPIFIHCGRKPDPDCWSDFSKSFIRPSIRAELPADFETRANQESKMGGIVGIAEIVDVVRHSSSPWYARGQYGWVLRNARPLPFLPYNGQTKLFPILFDIVMKHMGSHCWCCSLLEVPDPEKPNARLCECPKPPAGRCESCYKCDKHCWHKQGNLPLGKIYQISYSRNGSKVGSLMGSRSNIKLIDTRMKPYSGIKGWNRQDLEKEYGERYIWAGQTLGNKNYNTDLPIEIMNLKAGAQLVKRELKGHDAILICGCHELDACHTEMIAEYLRDEGIEVERPEQEPEMGRMIICQRSGPGRGCSMTWAPKDKCFLNGTPGIITETKMEGVAQLAKIKIAVDAPLLGRRLVSDHPKWIDSGLLKPRGTIIPELGEKE